MRRHEAKKIERKDKQERFNRINTKEKNKKKKWRGRNRRGKERNRRDDNKLPLKDFPTARQLLKKATPSRRN